MRFEQTYKREGLPDVVIVVDSGIPGQCLVCTEYKDYGSATLITQLCNHHSCGTLCMNCTNYPFTEAELYEIEVNTIKAKLSHHTEQQARYASELEDLMAGDLQSC